MRGTLRTGYGDDEKRCALGHLGVTADWSAVRYAIESAMAINKLYYGLYLENDDPGNLHPKRGACFYLMDVVEGIK